MADRNLQETAKRIANAKNVEDIFGGAKGDKVAQSEAVKVAYHTLVRVVHPDRYSGDAKDAERAQQAFVRLTELRKSAELKIEAGTYGKIHIPPPVPVDASPPPSTVVMVKKRKYILTQPAFAAGDLADLYRCTYEDAGVQHESVFKLARAAGDNDLLENESKVLAKLYPAKQTDEKYFRYLAKFEDSFAFRSPGGSTRRVNVMPFYTGYYSMAEVLNVYPKGLDYRDVVWMYKRLIVGLGYAHRQGYVHGAILPTHVLVHPVTHGARIVDWSYAVEIGKDRIRAISSPYREMYAPEILGKFVPTPATDIFMATKTAILMLGGDMTGAMPDQVPKALRGFLASCLLKSPDRRPQDAWQLHDELEDLLLRVVGKPKYRPLAIPPAAKA